jgi:molybdate transport system substrate-binding protein
MTPRRVIRLVVALGIGGWLFAASTVASEITVAAAADLKFALDDLVTEFRAIHTGTTVKVSYGSSGNFFAQLQNQAPFDVFFSADIDYPRRLAGNGRALESNVFLYAVGRIVLWAPNQSPVNVEKLGIASLFDPSVKKIAVANPRHAPYGAAAVAALKSLEAYQRVESRLIYGENVAQTAQFAQSGAADIGIIALSLAMAPPMRASGRHWEIPLESYPKLEHGGMILNGTKHPEAARRFRDFVLGERGRAVLEQYGFILP